MRKKSFLIALLTMLTVSCSQTLINRSATIDGEYRGQHQKGKQGQLIISPTEPYTRTMTYFYTNKNQPILDSLQVDDRTYTKNSDLGCIVLDHEQQNLEAYLEDLNEL